MAKKYNCIVKVEYDKIVKYHVNNLLSFVQFLDSNFKNWTWFNVYDSKTRKQITSYTKNNRPTTKTV